MMMAFAETLNKYLFLKENQIIKKEGIVIDIFGRFFNFQKPNNLSRIFIF
jgi:hypothetical protein